MSLIFCENITLAYDRINVLSDLSFSVEKGDYLCIVGENGSGKSTLVKALLNLIPVVSGKIEFGDGLARNGVAYLPQRNEAISDFPASVWEVVLSGTLAKKGFFSFYNKNDKLLAEENMKKLGIWELKEKSFRELSGGQQQRVLLARAISSNMELLLIDEPTTGLDPIVTAEFYELIGEINRSGITVIMVTHDIASAVKNASHILHLQNKPLFFGKVSEYLESDVGRKYING